MAAALLLVLEEKHDRYAGSDRKHSYTFDETVFGEIFGRTESEGRCGAE